MHTTTGQNKTHTDTALTDLTAGTTVTYKHGADTHRALLVEDASRAYETGDTVRFMASRVTGTGRVMKPKMIRRALSDLTIVTD